MFFLCVFCGMICVFFFACFFCGMICVFVCVFLWYDLCFFFATEKKSTKMIVVFGYMGEKAGTLYDCYRAGAGPKL